MDISILYIYIYIYIGQVKLSMRVNKQMQRCTLLTYTLGSVEQQKSTDQLIDDLILDLCQRKTSK